jgi:hypothetical protein
VGRGRRGWATAGTQDAGRQRGLWPGRARLEVGRELHDLRCIVRGAVCEEGRSAIAMNLLAMFSVRTQSPASPLAPTCSAWHTRTPGGSGHRRRGGTSRRLCRPRISQQLGGATRCHATRRGANNEPSCLVVVPASNRGLVGGGGHTERTAARPLRRTNATKNRVVAGPNSSIAAAGSHHVTYTLT